MKKNIIILAALGLAFGGCVKEDAGTSDINKAGRLVLEGGFNVETKAQIGDLDGTKYPVLWTEGDRVGVNSATPGAEIFNVSASLTAESAGKASGKFTIADAIGLAPEGATTLNLYYPYNESATFDEASSVINLSLSSEQEQSAPGASTEFLKYGLAWGKTDVTNPDDAVKFNLKHALAYVKVNVSSTALEGAVIKSISLSDPSGTISLAGKYKTDLNDGTFTDMENIPAVKVNVRKPSVVSSTSQSFYLAVKPADFTDATLYVAVNLLDADGVTNITIPVAKTGKRLEAGKMTEINISDLSLQSNDCPWWEPKESRYMADGWCYGDANCWMVSKDKDFKFSVKARGDFSKTREPKTARILWTGTNVTSGSYKISCNGIIHSGTADSDKNNLIDATSEKIAIGQDYDLTVRADVGGANAYGDMGCIAIYDAQDNIIWSYGIWVTPKVNSNQYNCGKHVMDRNLGAFSKEEDWKRIGVYVQWGRHTGFMGHNSSYQKLRKPANGTIESSITNPGHRLTTADKENSGAFLEGSWGDWCWTGHNKEDRRNDLWGNTDPAKDGIKSIYDPCPKGWRVVSPDVIKEVQDGTKDAEAIAISGKKDQFYVVYNVNGVNDRYMLAGHLLGYISKGSENDYSSKNYDTNALYWSNCGDSEKVNHAYAFKFFNKDYHTLTGTTNEVMRANAGIRSDSASVRCMIDDENR